MNRSKQANNSWSRLHNRWLGETVVCLASGPSLTTKDVEYVKGKARVITINTTYQIAPWADIHYATDPSWWREHKEAMNRICQGEYWTACPNSAREQGDDVFHIPHIKTKEGLCKQPENIVHGGNGGFAAMQIAQKAGASRIVMLGYDQSWPDGKTHWHGDHPEPLRNSHNWPLWRKHFEKAAKDFDLLGIEVVNASRHTTLECFTRDNLEDVIC